jgi:hypothetical protein
MPIQDREDGVHFLKNVLRAQIGRGSRKFREAVAEDHYLGKYNFMDQDLVLRSYYKTSDSVDIYLQDHDFERLTDILGHFHKNSNINEYYQDIARRVDVERTLRTQYPALQKAYEKYEIVLRMVANGQSIED